ncbi:MAG TPA: hypothetical protein VFV58_24795 [Blastocatellia bacterium]|jgi:hypothetical protein|nr:hypothetical protein [Blastocatellia bacterium]
MKGFFSRIIVATVFSLLAGFGLSVFSFNPDTLALANEAQQPDLLKEGKKRVKDEEKRLKEEEKRLKEEEEKKLKEEQKRLKEEEEKRLKEEENRLKEEENRLKEEEKKLKEKEKEEDQGLKAEENRLKLKEEEKRLKEEEKGLKEEQKRLKEEEQRRIEEAKSDKRVAASAPLRADGLDIAILMKDNQGVFAPVDPSREFVSGEQFRVEYDSRLDGIVYFVNVDPNGVTTVIYRDEVSYGKKYVHPAPEENKVIQFKGSPGIEVLKIIISTKELPELENALRENDGKLGTNTEQATDEPAGYVAPKQEPGKPCSGLELGVGRAKIDCRELSVVSQKQDQGKISVAVAPKGGGTGSDSIDSVKLSHGEVAVLEIRLKHVQ